MNYPFKLIPHPALDREPNEHTHVIKNPDGSKCFGRVRQFWKGVKSNNHGKWIGSYDIYPSEPYGLHLKPTSCLTKFHDTKEEAAEALIKGLTILKLTGKWPNI